LLCFKHFQGLSIITVFLLDIHLPFKLIKFHIVVSSIVSCSLILFLLLFGWEFSPFTANKTHQLLSCQILFQELHSLTDLFRKNEIACGWLSGSCHLHILHPGIEFVWRMRKSLSDKAIWFLLESLSVLLAHSDVRLFLI
jgi:hypothetical protein